MSAGTTAVAAAARQRRVTCSSASVACSDLAAASTAEGSAGATPLLFLHGFTGDRHDADAIAAELTRPRRILAPDLPGHGRTSVGDDDAYTMHGAAAVLVEMLDALGAPQVDVLGYSMGARLALYFALDHPERVRRLILEGGRAGIRDEAERHERRAADAELARFVEDRGIEAFVERWQASPVLAGERSLPASVRSGIRERRLSHSPRGLAASLRAMGAGAQPWLGDRLGELACPVLLITGANDRKFTAISRSLAEEIADARHAVVADAGHSVHLERPREYAALLEAFLGDERRTEAPTKEMRT